MDKRVYLDNAATTMVRPEVVDKMLDYFTKYYGNASSFHSFGREARKAMDIARQQVADLFHATPDEIFFTSGASESDNWAIEGICFKNQKKGKHIITSKIEHHAMLHTFEYMRDVHGYDVTFLDVDKEGFVDKEQLKRELRDDTVLVSIMYANNEIGTVQDIKELCQIAKSKGAYFHTDAVQAVGKFDIDVNDLGIDLLSMSGHKIHAPKGIGILYIKKGTRIDNFIHGGQQERGKRATTENIPAIVGLGEACKIAKEHLENNKKIAELRDYLIEGVLERIPYTMVTGSRTQRVSSNASFCFKFIEGEGMLILLDQVGIAGSSGSACTSGSLDPSHVLLAIGLPHETAHGSLRLSLSEYTTKEEIDYVLEKLPPIIERLRSMSPLYLDFVKGQNK